MSRRADRREVVVIMWRDIPAQVNGQSGRERHQVVLHARFQRAIDRAKRKARIVTAQDDVAAWHRISIPCDSHTDVVAAAKAEAKRLEHEYPAARLGTIAFQGGFDR